MSIFATAKINVIALNSNGQQKFNSDVSLNKSQVQGFISGDMDKATRMSIWDSIISIFYPDYNKAQALEIIKKMIEAEESATTVVYDPDDESDKLERMFGNFECLYLLADEGTKMKFEVLTNCISTKTEFLLDGHLLASVGAVYNADNDDLIEEDI